MQFRVGHEVRYEVILEAANAAEAGRMAEQMPYEEWHHNYVTSEDVIPMEESPVNPHAE
jgi:hypothetical protein